MINKAILVGNVGQDPEIITGDWGKMAKFSLATTEKWKNKQGEPQDSTEWHSIVIGGNLADVVEKFVKKGSKLFVEGKIKTSSYEKDGVTKYSTSINVFNMQMMDSKPKEQPSQNGKSATSNTPIPPPNDFNAQSDDLPF